jgi:hypothetical protein
MLMPFEIVLHNIVSVTDDSSKRYKQIGKITFIDDKLGFRRSYTYFDISVKFDDSVNDEIFKSWNLKLNQP